MLQIYSNENSFYDPWNSCIIYQKFNCCWDHWVVQKEKALEQHIIRELWKVSILLFKNENENGKIIINFKLHKSLEVELIQLHSLICNVKLFNFSFNKSCNSWTVIWYKLCP